MWQRPVEELSGKGVKALHSLQAENEKLRKGTGYFCWYSTGDTAANTPTRCMRKLANAGWSHVERGTCRNLDELGYFKCSECGHFTMERMAYRDGTPATPRYCPWCGRKVIE